MEMKKTNVSRDFEFSPSHLMYLIVFSSRLSFACNCVSIMIIHFNSFSCYSIQSKQLLIESQYNHTSDVPTSGCFVNKIMKNILRWLLLLIYLVFIREWYIVLLFLIFHTKLFYVTNQNLTIIFTCKIFLWKITVIYGNKTVIFMLHYEKVNYR